VRQSRRQEQLKKRIGICEGEERMARKKKTKRNTWGGIYKPEDSSGRERQGWLGKDETNKTSQRLQVSTGRYCVWRSSKVIYVMLVH
jgi:hypothetical protein